MRQPQVTIQDQQAVALTRWDRRACWALLFLLLCFGVVVEIRSAFSNRRMTDFDVYLRAAWAVRAGEDIYDISDDNGWHYQYPPLFAILMTPLADPPKGFDRTGMLPFAVSTAIWYLCSVGFLVFAVHHLASVLEERWGESQSQPVSRLRWWRLRTIPVLVCLVPAGQTLVRGQVTVLLLALLVGMAAALIRRRRFQAGLWLSGAICLKVIPAFLLLLPLWRRDLRCLWGCAAGLIVGLGLVPAAVFGVPRTIEYYVEFDWKVLRPGIGDDRDHSRAQELMQVTSTDSQSLVAMIHNTTYLDRNTRPKDATTSVRVIHWLLGSALTLLTLWAAGRKQIDSASGLILFLGALVFNMLLLSPVCHLHYYFLSMLLVIGILSWSWVGNDQVRTSWPLVLLFGFHVLAGLLPIFEGLEVLRDIGLATYGMAPLWGVSCFALLRLRREQTQLEVASHRAAAA